MLEWAATAPGGVSIRCVGVVYVIKLAAGVRGSQQARRGGDWNQFLVQRRLG